MNSSPSAPWSSPPSLTALHRSAGCEHTLTAAGTGSIGRRQLTAVALTGKAWSQLELSSRADGLDIIGNLHACQTAEAAVVCQPDFPFTHAVLGAVRGSPYTPYIAYVHSVCGWARVVPGRAERRAARSHGRRLSKTDETALSWHTP